jgi:hypothetical protein
MFADGGVLDVSPPNSFSLPWAWASRRATNNSRNITFAPPASLPVGSTRRVTSAPRTSPRSSGSHRLLLRARRPFHAGLPALRMEEGPRCGPPAIAAKLEVLADLGGVGLTPHQVAAVNETIDKMGSTGELKAFNRAFKEGAHGRPEHQIRRLPRGGRRHCWKLWLLRAQEPRLWFSALRSISDD